MKNQNDKTGGVILIADDESSFAEAFSQMLQMRGYDTVLAGNKSRIIELVRSRQFDLLTLDLEWEGRDYSGLDILNDVQSLDPLLPVIMVTGHGSIPTAVEATRLGAFDYIEKMTDREKTLLTIKNAIETGRLKKENRAFLTEIRTKYELIGHSRVMRQILDQIKKVGPTSSVVLITGKSGTGKELVARQIHYHSARREKRFVSVDSGTLADSLAESELFGHRKGAFTGATQDRAGLFADAEGGTLFLDEITNASLALQAKLLHVLQEREYRPVGENRMKPCDVRIIAASNRSLPDLIEENKFREDLYYRLKIIEIALPPLKKHKEDIPPLVEHFMKLKSRQYGGKEKAIQHEAANLFLDYDWPGNVRELENTIERIVILSDKNEITADDVQSILGNMWIEKTGSLKSLNEMTRQFKKECIIKAISLAEGKVARAAEILQVDRTHLYKLISEYQLKDPR